MMVSKKRYSAFTLLEMLVVMSIFTILVFFGFSAFSGFRDTIALSQDVLDLQQTIKLAQRAALYLERDQDERWVFGVGIDFTQVEADGSYRVFKWCSPYYDFGDRKTRSVIPNFDDDAPLSPLNGNLGLVAPYENNSCVLGSTDSEIIKTGGDIDPKISSNFRRLLPADNDATGDLGGIPEYILFEAVSGRAFFYDVSGMVLNYDSEGALVSTPIPFKLYIESERTNKRKLIRISNISGQLSVITEDL